MSRNRKAPAEIANSTLTGNKRCISSTNAGLLCSPVFSAKKPVKRLPQNMATTGNFARASICPVTLSARGEYKYFKYPLPAIVQQLRSWIYPHVAPLANQWLDRLGSKQPHYPGNLAVFTKQCHRAGQNRATPLMLKYGPGDFNCLHQDLYGEIFFPFQVTFFLSQCGRDFDGGEFVLAEQQPRRQSRIEVLAPNRGDAVIFSVHHRPVRGARGYYRATLRHGVSTIRSGERYTLGIIFHDAK
jgi:uncharacterized protein